jgi:hypothetical protein
MAHTVAAPAAQRSGPANASLERAPPRSRVYTSLERVPPRSRAHGSLERVPPRSRIHLRLAQGLPRTHARPRTRVRTFNALTRRGGAIMRLGLRPRPCCANSLGKPIPATVGDCAIRPVLAP